MFTDSYYSLLNTYKNKHNAINKYVPHAVKILGPRPPPPGGRSWSSWVSCPPPPGGRSWPSWVSCPPPPGGRGFPGCVDLPLHTPHPPEIIQNRLRHRTDPRFTNKN